jgi:3-oxoacyl-[acyl-carrier-protein] synthase-3
MRLGNVFIAGLAAYLPERVSVQDAIAAGDCDADKMETGWLGAAIAGDTSAPELAVIAGKQALERSGHEAEEIDLLAHVYFSHQGPEGWTPQHYILRHTVGRNIPALGMMHGCDGVVTAIDLAACYLTASPGRTAALVTTADNFGTPLVDRWRCHPGLVWGDAGAAVVLSLRTGFARLLATNSTSIPQMEELARTNGPLFPPDCTVGRPMNIAKIDISNGSISPAEAAAMIQKVEAELGARTLDEAGVSVSDITRVTHIHAGNEAFLAHHLQPLGLSPDRGIVDVGRHVGHLGTGDHLVGLNHLVEKGEVGPGDHVLMLGIGVGTGISCAVVEIVEQPAWQS